MSDLFKISALLNHEKLFAEIARQVGFSSIGDIDEFLFEDYANAVKQVKAPDQMKGAIFCVAPGTGKIDAAKLLASLQEIRQKTASKFHSLSLDTTASLTPIHAWSFNEKRNMVNGGWPQQVAQLCSKGLKGCVIWAKGVSVVVYMQGDIYMECSDVIEKLPSATTNDFQTRSWDDGKIIFEFSRYDLNDTSRQGVWKLKDKGVLISKPEEAIRNRLGEYLKAKLAGYKQHYKEAHVEHEGRADISLHFVDDRTYIVEVKWIGCSLNSTYDANTLEAIEAAFDGKKVSWFTKFDDTTIRSGVRQLASYYGTNNYDKAYLAVIDCTVPCRTSEVLSPDLTDLDGHDANNFRILRAAVDARPASVRAKRVGKKIIPK